MPGKKPVHKKSIKSVLANNIASNEVSTDLWCFKSVATGAILYGETEKTATEPSVFQEYLA